MNNETDPTFTLNGIRIRFNVNNARFPSNVDLVIEKESLDHNSVCFNISVKPKSTEGKSVCDSNLISEPVIADNKVIVESNHVEFSKSRVSFKASPFLLTDARSFSSTSFTGSATDSTFSQVSGFTNIFKQESNTLIPLVRNKFDSKAKLSRANVGAIESLNDSEMDAEEAIQTTEFDKGENAEHKILGYDEKKSDQSNGNTAARCESELKSMRNNLIEVLHSMESIQSKIESLQQKNRQK